MRGSSEERRSRGQVVASPSGLVRADHQMVEPAKGSLMHDHTSEEAAATWMAQGNCRNYPPEAFFPSDGVGVDRARKICATCSVIDTCREYALHNRIEHGVWGGCSERERRRILTRRRLAVTPG